MADKQAAPSEEEQIKRRLLWQKVNEPKFVKEEAGKTKSIYQSSSLGKAGVPMIPENLLKGSSSNMTENKVFKSMSLNPLVPIGMALTVGCLMGMFKSSLQNNMRKTQYYMRGRVAAQAFTVIALIGGATMMGLDPRGYSNPEAIPKEPDSLTKTLLGQNN